jgi:hypothetical protein
MVIAMSEPATVKPVNPIETPVENNQRSLSDMMVDFLDDPEKAVEKYGGNGLKEMMSKQKEIQDDIAKQNAKTFLTMAESIDKRFNNIENMLKGMQNENQIIKRYLKRALKGQHITDDDNGE